MHDPMAVAFEIRRPWPRRSSAFGRGDKPDWQVTIHGGKWWRPGAYSPFVRAFGKTWYFPSLVTIWHVEPGGADSGEVCKHWVDGKHRNAWRYHVHHWHLQISPLQKLRRWIFERCELCGRRYPYGYAPISHQWDRQRDGHWWNITAGAYHHECSSLVSLRTTVDQDVAAFREIVAMARVFEDITEDEWVNRHLWGKPGTTDFGVRRRVWTALGYEYDDSAGKLVLTAQGSDSLVSFGSSVLDQRRRNEQ